MPRLCLLICVESAHSFGQENCDKLISRVLVFRYGTVWPQIPREQLSVHDLQQAPQQPVQPARAHGDARWASARLSRLLARVAVPRRAAQACCLPTRPGRSTEKWHVIFQLVTFHHVPITWLLIMIQDSVIRYWYTRCRDNYQIPIFVTKFILMCYSHF